MKKSMKWVGKLIVTCLVVSTVACGGSSEPGPEADASKTPAEVKAEVKTQDTTVIEKAVASYESALEDMKGEAKDLEEQIKEAGGKMLDGLLGDANADELKAEAEAKVAELKAELEKLQGQIEDMVAKLKVYTDELASRA